MRHEIEQDSISAGQVWTHLPSQSRRIVLKVIPAWSLDVLNEERVTIPLRADALEEIQRILGIPVRTKEAGGCLTANASCLRSPAIHRVSGVVLLGSPRSGRLFVAAREEFPGEIFALEAARAA